MLHNDIGEHTVYSDDSPLALFRTDTLEHTQTYT